MRDTNDTHSSRGLSSTSSRVMRFALPLLASGSILFATPRTAHADEVKPDGKGITGGAFLGAEIVVFTEALFGVRSGTAYLLGAGGGAIAGAAGGYAVETAVSDGRIPAYMLAGGLALIIPALVITLDQTRYLPTEGAREDKPVTNLPPSDPGKPGGSAVIGAEPKPAPGAAPSTPSTPPAGGTTPAPAPAAPPGGAGGGGTPSPVRSQSLLNLREGAGFYVGVPVPEVRQVFSAAQKKEFAVGGSANELRFPVVHVTF